MSRHWLPCSKNKNTSVFILLAVLIVIITLVVSACGQRPGDPSTTKEEAMVTGTKNLVTSANDGWRYYSFDPQSIRSWTDEEGIDVIDVMITIDYKDNPGNAAKEDQLWHIDKPGSRYRVSDTIAYDLEGKACEV